MGAHMKTTIEISDALFATAKEVAHSRQTTLRALIEEGLRRNWEQGKRSPTGAAKALLKVLDKAPEAALAALS